IHVDVEDAGPADPGTLPGTQERFQGGDESAGALGPLLGAVGCAFQIHRKAVRHDDELCRRSCGLLLLCHSPHTTGSCRREQRCDEAVLPGLWGSGDARSRGYSVSCCGCHGCRGPAIRGPASLRSSLLMPVRTGCARYSPSTTPAASDSPTAIAVIRVLTCGFSSSSWDSPR